MPLLDLDKLTAGLSTTWSGFLRDWDRSLRSRAGADTGDLMLRQISSY
ncbi:hypothetical protein [Streptomyces sp. GESEQ-4]|nr:hypothetical protein [Streptomyces sp. GESEQ-4]